MKSPSIKPTVTAPHYVFTPFFLINVISCSKANAGEKEIFDDGGRKAVESAKHLKFLEEVKLEKLMNTWNSA